jgi:hypothetical protein
MSMRHIVAGAPALYTHRLCACSRIGCAPLRGCCIVGTLLQKCHGGLRPLSAPCARASRSLLRARFAGRGPGTVYCCIVDTVLHKCHSPLRGRGAALAAARLGDGALLRASCGSQGIRYADSP